jgi:hypothetical protein
MNTKKLATNLSIHHNYTLSKFFNVQEDKLQTIWLDAKIRLIIQNDPVAVSALNILIKGIEGNENN